METKYIDYLKSRGWEMAVYGPSEGRVTSQLSHSAVDDILLGIGDSVAMATEDLNEDCKFYINRIEKILNLELVP